MTTLRPYPAYKPSGVDWLDAIPSHWRIDRLRKLANIRTSGAWGEDPEDDEDGVRVATTAQIDDAGALYPERMGKRRLTKQERNAAVALPGDILVVKSSGSAENVISGKSGLVLDMHGDIFSVTFCCA